MGVAAERRGGLILGLLGPVELGGCDAVAVGLAQPMQRVLLGLLAVAGGRVVAADALIDGLWGAEWSREREANLHSQVSALRRRLEEVEPGRGRSRLARSGGGYRLILDEATMDVSEFEVLAGRGRDAARAGDAGSAAKLLRQALDLWRGPALADAVSLCSRLAGDAARLEELRVGVIEDLADCDLALGRHGEVADELTSLAAQLPLRERLASQLMLALYRCGRRGEALAAFDRTRRVLAAELGLDPGPMLRELHARMLADDPALAAPAGGPDAVPPTAPEFASRPLAGRGNIPAPAASFIGREAELAELGKLVERHRLVTIVGAGGAGKTRLAIEVAKVRLDKHRDGGWFIDLAGVTDASRLPDAIADAVGIRNSSERPVADLVIEHATGMQALLVLDNCEHVVDAVAPLAERILEAGPGVRLLATSRQSLGLPGEMVWQTPPIAFPSGDDLHDAVDLAGFDAVRLFLERAPRLQEGDVTQRELQIIADITASLDGLPLAIELAAARAAQLDLDQLAAALRDRLGLSLLRSRTAHSRQRTLEDTIRWSYDLLTPELRAALQRLSVFSGGFTLAAAEAVIGPPAHITEIVVLLAERSLITVDRSRRPRGAGPLRYRMLETIRQYCAGRIASEDGPDKEVGLREAHAQYFADLASRAAAGLTGWQQGRWLSELEADYANLIVAVNNLLSEPGRAVSALEVVVHLDRFWHNRGHLAECAGLLDRALEAAGEDAVPSLRSAALSLHGQIALKGDTVAARSYFNAALELAETAGDDARAATALWGLTWTHFRTGDAAAGTACSKQAVARARASGDLVRLGESLLTLADPETLDPRAIEAGHAEALTVTSQTGDRIQTALVHNNLGNHKLAIGDLTIAQRHFEQAQAILAEIGAPSPWPLLNMGWIQLRRGRLEAASAAFTEALQMPRVQHMRRETTYLVLGFACRAAAAADWERAARLVGFADAQQHGAADQWTEPERTYREEALRAARLALGPDFQRHYDLGASTDRGDVIDSCLGRRPLPSLSQPSSWPPGQSGAAGQNP
jgi:predicted ATPase/DNA-binding SARP family transcriptional activator/Tfp pilus assembly protein PilF